jgi:hypothetical protein
MILLVESKLSTVAENGDPWASVTVSPEVYVPTTLVTVRLLVVLNVVVLSNHHQSTSGTISVSVRER